MTNSSQIIERFVEQAGTERPRFLRPKSSNIELGSWAYRSADADIDTVYSYGRHFPLAQLMPDMMTGERRGWWLLNGDRYSVTTSGHQSAVQSAVKRSGLPYMIVPQSAIERAHIKAGTIKPVDILPDRYTWVPREREEGPGEYERRYEGQRAGTRYWEQLDSGRWSYESSEHHLGEALFTAEYAYDEVVDPAHTDLVSMERYRAQWAHREGTAYFLSAFDANEPGFGLYFLAQLPDGAQPQTVAEAFEALKPDEVKDAEALGLEVLRQGDVFAIATTWPTRGLPGPSKRSKYVLGVNHLVTEVRTVDEHGITYGRGTMRHAPREWGRQPEHRRLKLGDGKTWYQLVRNTVPDGRSWSVGGNVD